MSATSVANNQDCALRDRAGRDLSMSGYSLPATGLALWLANTRQLVGVFTRRGPTCLGTKRVIILALLLIFWNFDKALSKSDAPSSVEPLAPGRELSVVLTERAPSLKHAFQLEKRSHVRLVFTTDEASPRSEALNGFETAFTRDDAVSVTPQRQQHEMPRSDALRTEIYLLPAGRYKLAVSLTKDAQGAYWVRSLPLKIVVSDVIPAPVNPAVADLVRALPTLRFSPDSIDLIDYRIDQPAMFSSRDSEISIRLIPAVAQAAKLQEDALQGAKVAPKSGSPATSSRSSEIWKAYADLFEETRPKEEGVRAPYFRSAEWLARNSVPQIIILMPPFRGHERLPFSHHDRLKQLNWPYAIEQISKALNVPPTQIAVLFLDGCDVTVVTYPSPSIVNVDYSFGCAMSAGRGEILEGSVDLSAAVPAFLTEFLPKEARLQFEKATETNAEVVVRGLKGSVVPGGRAWERIELIFNLEPRTDKPHAVVVQVVVDAKLAYAIGQYPPDTQFTTLSSNGDLQSFAKTVSFNFDAFVKKNNLYQVPRGRVPGDLP